MRYIYMTIKGQRRQEGILYAVLWTILFAAPLLSMYIDRTNVHAEAYDWASTLSAWRLLLVYLGVFLAHNFLLAPLLVFANRKWTYFSMVAAMLLCFSFYQCMGRPHPEPPRPMPHHTKRPTPPPGFEDHGAPRQPPHPFGGEDMGAILIMSMLFGLNIGAKYYFRLLDEKKQMKDLEHQHLQEQLNYLKYQINPHFFMNTLNNIHALVEINPEQAQRAIEILSGLMRYVLYEANKPTAPLAKEVQFVRNYMDIMRIRYVDTVEVSLSLPDNVPDVLVPPLIFATFIENAFKHGVSYEQPSFVKISIETTGEHVCFSCRNSIRPKAEEGPKGGVGMTNAQKRLQLIYGEGYTLTALPSDGEYAVELRLPYIKPSKKEEYENKMSRH